jgi:hypothetical protein
MQYIIVTPCYKYAGNITEFDKKLFSNIQSAKNFIFNKNKPDFTEEEILNALGLESDLEPKHSWGGNYFKIEHIDFIE